MNILHHFLGSYHPVCNVDYFAIHVVSLFFPATQVRVELMFCLIQVAVSNMFHLRGADNDSE